MAKERFARAMREVERLLDEDEGTRARALAALEREDATLAAEVCELLARAATNSADGALVARARREAARLLSSSEPMPERVGPFKLLALLGRGGMGAVYRAEQERPRRQVALKLLLSSATTRDVAARFGREAEALARLSHPGIARIFDAGVDSGADPPRPWIAMELVEGQPITDHAARAELGLRERAELLAQVSTAVAHAHAKGVLHRDLKPANVLVGEDGRPRVLDFGVARLLEEEGVASASFATSEGQLVGTLAYMSPEQAAGETLDTRSDVYALGLLGYELFTGRRAQDVSGLPVARALQLVQEAEIRPAQALDPHLRGDLATILAKALRREREERYESAADLAADLRRYLADEPIAARPPSTIYHLRKFARRNRALVGGTLATVLALALGLVGTSVQAARAEREADLARANERRAKEAAGVLMELFRAGQTHEAEGKRPLEQVVLEGRAALEGALLDAPLERASLLDMLGHALLYAGRHAEARELLLEALALREEHSRGEEVGSWRLHCNLGAAATELGLSEEAARHLRRGIALLRGAAESASPASLVTACQNLARLECRLGRHVAALALCEEALATARDSQPSQVPRSELLLAVERHHAAPSEATFAEMRAAWAEMEADPSLRDARPAYEERLASELLIGGRARQDASLVLEACALFERSIFNWQTQVGCEQRIASALQSLAAAYQALGDPESMLALQQEATRLYVSAGATAEERAESWIRLARCYSQVVGFAEAHAPCERGYALAPPPLLDDLFLVAEVRQQMGDSAGAVEVLCEARTRVLDSGAHPAEQLEQLRTIDARLGVAMLLAGEVAQAEPLLREVLEQRRAVKTPPALLASSEQLHAWALLRLGRVEEAEEQLLSGARGLFESGVPPASGRGQLCVRSLVELYDALGDEGEVARWRAQLTRGG